MARRILNKTATGTDGVNFGGEDLDYVNKLLTGVDQGGTDPVDINTTWKFRNGKARIQGESSQVSIINSAAASSDKTWTLPNVTDTAVGLDANQTLTNKIISGASNTLSNIPKSALPATTVSNDQNNALGAFYEELTEIAAPSNPSSGSRRIYIDSTTHKLSVRTSAGTSVSLEEQAAGGSWDPNAAETLTNKTIAFASNTLTNVASINTAQTISAAKTFNDDTLKLNDSAADHAYTISTPDLAANRTLTLPLLTGDDTAVTEAHTQTLTFKTLITPTIASIINGSGTLSVPSSGTWTVPNVTDTAVGKATTDTMTNKTFDAAGTGNVLQNVPLYPDKKLWGTWIAATGTGTSAGTNSIFNASRAAVPTGQGTITLTVGSSGRFATFPTDTTIDHQAGIRFDAANAAIIRNKNGRIKFKFRINEAFVSGASTYRFVLGIHSTTGSYLTGNDPTAAGSGIFLCVRDTDTNFVIAHRGTGTSTYTTTAITPDTSAHTFEIKAVTDSEWQWSYDGGAFTSVSSEIPASTSNQVPHAYIQSATSSGTIRTWDLWYIYAEQDP